MTRPSFTEALASRPWLLADGATGTNYFQMGLQSGDAPEMWNFEHPERVRTLHRRFIEAGADIVLTNSFGGNRYRLKLHNAQDRVREVNMAAAKNARAEADAAGRPVYVGGSFGPTGEIFQPVGALSHEDGVAAFEEQAFALKDGGVDVLWIETMSSEEELRAAVEGAAKAGLPAASLDAIESGEQDPSASTLEALASAIGVPASWLFGDPKHLDVLTGDTDEEASESSPSDSIDPVTERILRSARHERELYVLLTALLRSGDPKLVRAAEVNLRSLVKQAKQPTVPWQSRPPGHFEPPSD